MRNGKETLTYITNQIRSVCKEFKNRCGGSPSERACQKHFFRELAKYADTVREEMFSFHPKAFMGWIIPCGILNVLAVALYWLRAFSASILIPIAGSAFVTLSLLTFVFEFFLYRRFTDAFYPKGTSVNVYASRKPRGEVRRRIIFGGHADAAYEMTYCLQNNVKRMYAVFYGSVAGVIYVLLLNAATLIATLALGPVPLSGIPAALGIAAAGFVPFFIASMFFINWSRVVDGANDNLTGCLVSLSVLREMFITGERLEHTEVCCLITGCEEEGLRGAAAFAEANKAELRGVETIFIAVETLRETGQLKVYTRGINGTQKNSEDAGKLLQQAGRRRGIHLPIAGWYPGATDAEAFSREGIASCGLCGVDHIPKTYYHTRHDNPDNMDEGCIRASLEICLETARLYDKLGGLIAAEGQRRVGQAAEAARGEDRRRRAVAMRVKAAGMAIDRICSNADVPKTRPTGVRRNHRTALAYSPRP
ncbi:MAG: M20/M25/M40 family metallo-hydrolase [Bacillota bacterium]